MFQHFLGFVFLYIALFIVANLLYLTISIRGLFDKFVDNVDKFVSVHSILLVFAYDTGQYVYDRYSMFQWNISTRKNTHVLLRNGYKHCRPPNEK